MKKMFVFMLVGIMAFACVACESKKESIEGYWMADDGETISFDADGKSIRGGVSMDYSIYDKNNLSLTCLGIAKEYRFDIKNNILSLRDLSDNSLKNFYKDEQKQKEIHKRLLEQKKFREQKRIEEEEKLRQQEIQEKIQREHDEKVNSLYMKINEINDEIAGNTKNITYQEKYIAQKEKDIQDEKKDLEEVKNEMANLQHSPDSYDDYIQSQILYLQSKIDMHNDNINNFNEQINYYNQNIAESRKNITDLNEEKEIITDELAKLEAKQN